MSCQVNFPIDDVADAITERIMDLPAEKFVASQVLQGNKLIMTLSDDSTIDTDVSALL